MFKKPWNGIKLIVTLKSKDKTAPNPLILNENNIANKSYIPLILNENNIANKSYIVEILSEFFVNVHLSRIYFP